MRDDVATAPRADSRSRSIVFRAMRLVDMELPAGERGVSVARQLTNRALPGAWDRRVLDLEGAPWDLLERLVRAADLSTIWTERTVRAAFLRLHEACPDLFVRLNHYEYLVPFGELRDPNCARLARLEAWCRDTERQQRSRELQLRVRDMRGRRLDSMRQSLASRLRRYGRATAFPRPLPLNPDRAREAVVEELERLGPAVQGQGGDHRTFVAACMGEDFGLSPQEFQPLLEQWNEGCEPPWSPRDLEKKLDSALRNRKRPASYRLLDAPGTVTPRSGLAPSLDYSAASVWEAALQLSDGQALAGIVWAERRGFDPPELLRRDLVRVLSSRLKCSRTLRVGGVSWLEAGYRLLLPIFDHRGELAGVRARQIDGPLAAMSPRGEAPLAGAKEIMPAGHMAQGLCFADEVGRDMLRGRGEAPREVWIAEGGPDFLTAVCRLGEVPGRAVLGIFAGSWTAELAAKIPAGARVVIATDADGPGKTYARRIAATLAGRCELMRLELPAELRDLNAAHCAGRLDLAALRPFEAVRAAPVMAPKELTGCAWDRRALELINCWPNFWEGPTRELARTLLLFSGKRAPQAAVRGLERALLRLRERGQLPQRFTLTAAWTPPVGGQEIAARQGENESAVVSGPVSRGDGEPVHRDFKPDNALEAGSGAEVSRDFKPDNVWEAGPGGWVHRDFKPDNVMTGTSGPDFWDEEGHLDRKSDQGLGVEQEEVGRERAENEFGATFGADFQGEAGLVHCDFKPESGLATELSTEQDRGQQTSASGAARRELERNLAEMTRASPEVRARLAALRRERPKP